MSSSYKAISSSEDSIHVKRSTSLLNDTAVFNKNDELIIESEIELGDVLTSESLKSIIDKHPVGDIGFIRSTKTLAATKSGITILPVTSLEDRVIMEGNTPAWLYLGNDLNAYNIDTVNYLLSRISKPLIKLDTYNKVKNQILINPDKLDGYFIGWRLLRDGKLYSGSNFLRLVSGKSSMILPLSIKLMIAPYEGMRLVKIIGNPTDEVMISHIKPVTFDATKVEGSVVTTGVYQSMVTDDDGNILIID